MAGTYDLINLNVNRPTDQGGQQVSIRPYGAVTSLNANQLIDHIVEHGVYNMDVEFTVTHQTLTVHIPAGFVAYAQNSVNEDQGEVTVERPYVVRVAFTAEATTSFNFGDLAIEPPFVNEDRGQQVGVEPPVTALRLFLILRYSWEEGMLGSAADAGEGTGAGSVGRYAALSITDQSPQTLASLDPARYSTTMYLGEILNLNSAANLDGDTWELTQSLFRFRPQIWSSRTYRMFEKLREANTNFHIDYNPTGDYLYVGGGRAVIGSDVLEIPRGLRHRIRAIVPLAFENEDVPSIFSKGGDLDFTEDGIPMIAGEEIPYDDTEILGQYDTLCLNREGEIGWVTRPMTATAEASRTAASDYVSGNEDKFYRQPVSQTPTSRHSSSIANVISRFNMDIDDVYLILAVYRRVYSNDGVRKTLPSVVWPTEPWELYTHNPLQPLLSDPAAVRITAVSHTLVIPVEENGSV